MPASVSVKAVARRGTNRLTAEQAVAFVNNQDLIDKIFTEIDGRRAAAQTLFNDADEKVREANERAAEAENTENRIAEAEAAAAEAHQARVAEIEAATVKSEEARAEVDRAENEHAVNCRNRLKKVEDAETEIEVERGKIADEAAALDKKREGIERAAEALDGRRAQIDVDRHRIDTFAEDLRKLVADFTGDLA